MGRKIIAASMALAVAACSSAPATPAVAPTDASFAWGCWVSKEEPGGRIHAFLRLLKDGPDGKLYEGYLHDVRGSDMIPLLHLSLARDGSGATIVRDGHPTTYAPVEAAEVPVPGESPRLHFAAANSDRVSLLGGNDHLSLTIHTGRRLAIHEFERDGCD
ncbi:MAG: hypothetical protein EOP29_04265 [Rhodococcus sp. (in: high G+C Gram-positive bacteria)]|nr:MAG: hypothetical protein EOP29_04265 [Rhodococcus sp. (in: high G+C Gram-positive bacteria)]